VSTTLGEVIRSALANDAAVVALVGTKIFPNVAPQGTLAPWIVYIEVSAVPENSFTSAVATQLVNSRLQVDCYAKQYLEAHAIGDAVNAVLSALATADVAIWRTLSRDLYDNDAQLHRVSTEFSAFR